MSALTAMASSSGLKQSPHAVPTRYVIINKKEPTQYTAYKFLYLNGEKNKTASISYQKIHELVTGSVLGEPKWTEDELLLARAAAESQDPELTEYSSCVTFRNPQNIRFLDPDKIFEKMQ